MKVMCLKAMVFVLKLFWLIDECFWAIPCILYPFYDFAAASGNPRKNIVHGMR
jgi:hypothetical protein